MPFSGNTFTLPAGATNAVAGQIIQSATWNAIHSDLNTGLTQLMSQLTTQYTVRNVLRDNGGMEVWQRGTTISQNASATAYAVDRWYLISGANQASTISQQAGLVTGSQFSAAVQRNSGQTGVTGMIFSYPFDTIDIQPVLGKVVTLSFVVKAGSNWSPANGTLTYALYCGTGAAGKRGGTPYTNETAPISGSINLTTSNQAVSVNSSVVVPITTTQMELLLTWTPVGTASTNDFFVIDDVQLEPDNSTTTWTPNIFDRQSFDLSLLGCKRYYQKTFPYATTPAQGGGTTGALALLTQAAAAQSMLWVLPVEMRTDPSVAGGVTTYNPSGASANWQNLTAATSVNATVNSITIGSAKQIYITSGSTSAAVSLALHVAASAGL